MTPEDLNAAWLSRALGQDVSEVTVTEIVWGTATKVRLSADGLALCAKGGFDERLAGWGLEPAYELEARFFAELAPALGEGLPRCWFAGGGVVVLEDLVARGCTFGDPTQPWPADRVAAALELLARWHATARAPAWLPLGAAAARGAAVQFLGAEHWDAHFAQDGAPSLPASLQDPAPILRAFERLWALDDDGPHCVVHGDAHIGNTYLDAYGTPGFLDWQTVCRGPWSYDVAYFVGGALSVADRRAHERALLDGYLEALRAHGGPRIDADDAWRDYVRHTLHGFLWAATPPVMQTPERVRAMAERYVAAIEDHETLGALTV
ncbi:MAG TPA: aminoglycoside phosphotransferase family protein [Solirubrobacteraceae bacterium]